MNEPETIREMLGADGPGRGEGRASAARTLAPAIRTLAVVGLSPDARKASHRVSEYMQQQGYWILPVNPGVEEVLGERSYASLTELPVKPDVVNVFRLPQFVPGIVEEMIVLGLRDLWVQTGIVNLEAARRAEEVGIRVVMDRCIMVEHRRLE